MINNIENIVKKYREFLLIVLIIGSLQALIFSSKGILNENKSIKRNTSGKGGGIAPSDLYQGDQFTTPVKSNYKILPCNGIVLIKKSAVPCIFIIVRAKKTSNHNTEFSISEFGNLIIKIASPGGIMNNNIASKSSLKVNCNLISITKGISKICNSNDIRTEKGRLIFAVLSSFSSNSEYEYDGTITQITEDILPSNITDIISRNPAGVTLTGKLIVTNAFYMLAGNNNQVSDNLTLSNSDVTALTISEGYTLGSPSESVSSSSDSFSFAFGNSTLGSNVSINMITPNCIFTE